MNNKLYPLFNKLDQETASCKNHPYGYVGKNNNGDWLENCWLGKKHNETCEITINELHEEKEL
jgi:hypothetical protein